MPARLVFVFTLSYAYSFVYSTIEFEIDGILVGVVRPPLGNFSAYQIRARIIE